MPAATSSIYTQRCPPSSRCKTKRITRLSPKNLTADFRRLSQIRIRTFHRRDAEYAEEIPFAQSGEDDWAKTFSSNLKNVFVCRRLPTNKNLILCALCVSAVNKSSSALVCVNLRLICLVLSAVFPWRLLRLCPSISLGVLRFSKDASHLFPDPLPKKPVRCERAGNSLRTFAR